MADTVTVAYLPQEEEKEKFAGFRSRDGCEVLAVGIATSLAQTAASMGKLHKEYE